MNQQSRLKTLIIGLSISIMLASVGTSMANLVLPAVSAGFEISFSGARWIVLSYLIASTVFSLFIGVIGDRVGRSHTLLAGTVLYIAGALLSGFSNAFGTLLLSRIIQGIGGAALLVIPLALISESVPQEKVGKAIGLLATASAIGTAAGPSIGGLLLGVLGWRSPFFTIGVLGFLNLILLTGVFPSKFQQIVLTSERFNSFSATKTLLLDRTLRSQLLSNFVVSAIMMSTLIVGPFYLTNGLYLDPMQVGLVMSAGPITSAVSGILSGHVVDRFGSTPTLKFGLFQLLIGTISFIIAPPLFGAIGFTMSAVLLSIGYQLFLASNSSGTMKLASQKQKGTTSGALTLSRNLGLISGTIVMGYTFDLFARESIAAGLQTTFVFASLLIVFLLLHHLTTEQRR
jgi:MFS family permease